MYGGDYRIWLMALVVLLLSGCQTPAPRPTPSPVASNPSGIPTLQGPAETPSPTPETPVSSPTPSKTPSPSPTEVRLKGSAISGKSGENVWELKCDAIKYVEAKKAAEVSTVEFTMFDKKKKPRVTVTSEAADVDMEKLNVKFRGKVLAKAASGETLEVEQLFWNGKEHKFFGKESIRFSRGQSFMTGQSLVADATMKTIEITGDVHIYLREQDSGKLKLP